MSETIDKPIDKMAQPSESETSASNARGIMFMLQDLQTDPHKMAFAVGILVGLITLLLIAILSRKGFRKLAKKAVLLVGPSDAGKTLLFSQLVHNKPIESFTSMIENVGQYSGSGNLDENAGSNVAPGKTLEMYDLPGHDRLRYSALDKRKEEARAIIYVIDASTIKQKLRDSAEFLFNILRDPCLFYANTPVMVVCNKQDLGIQAKGAGVIERELAKEIGLLRVTQSRLLEDSSGTGNRNANIYLGEEGKDFEFSDLRAEVKFVEASAARNCEDNDSGIPAIQQWIAAKA